MTGTSGDGPFSDLRRALQHGPDDSPDEADHVRLVRVDQNRLRLTGVPEIVLAV